MTTNIQKFFALLNAADAVTVDSGAVLTNWDTDPCVGQPDNQVAYFTWTDEEGNFSCTLDENGIENGTFDDEGKFSCDDAEGESTVIQFFRMTPLTEA